jgi:hypothetical protein
METAELEHNMAELDRIRHPTLVDGNGATPKTGHCHTAAFITHGISISTALAVISGKGF